MMMVQFVLLLFAGLASASEPSFSEYVRKFAGDIAAGDNSVVAWNNLGVALINRGNELPRQGGAQIAYTQARNALYKALSRARGMKAEDAPPGESFDDIMANIETLQSECEAHAGRDAAQALRSLPPRTFNFDIVRPLLALDVHGDVNAQHGVERITHGGSGYGESDRDGHRNARGNADTAESGTAGGDDGGSDGDGDDDGDGDGDGEGDDDSGGEADAYGDGGSDDEKNIDEVGAGDSETEFKDVVPWPEARASRRDSTGMSARSRALVSLINCEKRDCVLDGRRNEELFRVFPRRRAVELIDAEMAYLESSFSASGGNNNTYISDIHIKANRVTLVKLWLSMGNRRLAISAGWTFFLNASLVTFSCLALYLLGVFMMQIWHTLHRLLLRVQHSQGTTESSDRLDSFDGLRALLIGQTVFGHYASWWRCVGNFAHTIEYRSATLRLFGLQPVIRFVLMPFAFVNMVHLSVSATFTMAGFVVAWPLFPLRRIVYCQDDDVPDFVPKPLLTVRSTLQWSLGFYAAKLRRIWIPFVSILLIVFALNRGAPEELPFRQFVVDNALFMAGATAHEPWYFRPGLWSLVPYVQFLLMAPVLLFFAARSPRLLLALVASVCFAVRVLYPPRMRHCSIDQIEHDRCFSLLMSGGVHELVSNSPMFISPDSICGRLDDFVSGIVTCVLMHRGAAHSVVGMMVAGMASYFSGCVLWNMSMLGMHTKLYVHSFANMLLWIGNSLVLASLARSQVEGTRICPVNWFLRWPLMRHIGSVQYAIYFVHQAYYHEIYHVLGSTTQSEPGRAQHPNAPKEGETAWHAFLAAAPVLAKVYVLSFCVECAWRRVLSGTKRKHTAAQVTRQHEICASDDKANHRPKSGNNGEALSYKKGKND